MIAITTIYHCSRIIMTLCKHRVTSVRSSFSLEISRGCAGFSNVKPGQRTFNPWEDSDKWSRCFRSLRVFLHLDCSHSHVLNRVYSYTYKRKLLTTIPALGKQWRVSFEVFFRRASTTKALPACEMQCNVCNCNCNVCLIKLQDSVQSVDNDY